MFNNSEKLVLAVDPARSSGWAIGISRACDDIQILKSGVISDIYKSRDMENVINYAICLAHKNRVELELVLENWSQPNKQERRSMNSLLGLGATQGVWKREYLLQCQENPIKNGRKSLLNKKIKKIYVQTWRSGIFNSFGYHDKNKKYHKWTTEEWKKEAIKKVSEKFGILCGDDEAEAVLLCFFALTNE